jgi:putative ABC transport system substrate-binding protein
VWHFSLAAGRKVVGSDIARRLLRGAHMQRRAFITLLGSAAAWPLAARAQQPTRVARIGYLSGTGSAADPGPFVEALQQGMREQGYVDGKDFIVEYRGAEGRQARVPELVAELVQAKVDVLVTPFPSAIRAAKQANRYDSDCHGDVYRSGC